MFTHSGDMAYAEQQKQFGVAKRDTLPQILRRVEKERERGMSV